MDNLNLYPLLFIPIGILALIGVYRFWDAAALLGLRRQLMWADSGRLQMHLGIIAASVTMIGYSLYGIVAPALWPDDHKAWAINVALLALLGVIGWIGKQCALEVAWFRVREQVLRAMAMAQLITAAELAHALRVAQEYNAAQRTGRPYNVMDARPTIIDREAQQ